MLLAAWTLKHPMGRGFSCARGFWTASSWISARVSSTVTTSGGCKIHSGWSAAFPIGVVSCTCHARTWWSRNIAAVSRSVCWFSRLICMFDVTIRPVSRAFFTAWSAALCEPLLPRSVSCCSSKPSMLMPTACNPAAANLRHRSRVNARPPDCIVTRMPVSERNAMISSTSARKYASPPISVTSRHPSLARAAPTSFTFGVESSSSRAEPARVPQCWQGWSQRVVSSHTA